MESKLKTENEKYPVIVSFMTGEDEYDFFRIGCVAAQRLGYTIGYGRAAFEPGDSLQPTITTDSEESKSKILTLVERTSFDTPTGSLSCLDYFGMYHRFYFALSGLEALQNLLGIDNKILDLPVDILERGFVTAVRRSEESNFGKPLDFVPGEREYFDRIKGSTKSFTAEEITSMVTQDMMNYLRQHPELNPN